MFIRHRQRNLSLERAVYVPAVRDIQGALVAAARRTTQYLGSVAASLAFDDLPATLLAKLTIAEQAQLQAALQANARPADAWLAQLPANIARAADSLKAAARDPAARGRLLAELKAAEATWSAFFRAAQDLGLRRRVNRPRKTK